MQPKPDLLNSHVFTCLDPASKESLAASAEQYLKHVIVSIADALGSLWLQHAEWRRASCHHIKTICMSTVESKRLSVLVTSCLAVSYRAARVIT